MGHFVELLSTIEAHWQHIAHELINATFEQKSCINAVQEWIEVCMPMVSIGAPDVDTKHQVQKRVNLTNYEAAGWNQYIGQHVQQRTGWSDTTMLPYDIWVLVGEGVFRDPFLHEMILNRISTMLNGRIYNWMKDVPVLEINPATLWLMFTLSAQIIAAQKTLTPSMNILLQDASKSAQIDHWADFWDQWLLVSYLSTVSADQVSKNNISQIITQLPIQSSSIISNKRKTQIGKTDIHIPSWFNQINPRKLKA